MVSFCFKFCVQSKHRFCCGVHFGRPEKTGPPELIRAISSGAGGWLQGRCTELYNTNQFVEATKLSFPLPQTNFWQRRQLRAELTKRGQHLPKGRYRLVTLCFSEDKGCWQGSISGYWLNSLMQDTIFAHYLGSAAEFPSSSVFGNFQSITIVVHLAYRQGQGMIDL